MQFENLAARKKLLMDETFSRWIETQVEQLRFVLHRVQSMLDEHPDIELGTSRIRVANFAGAAFALEMFAYGKTGDFAKFTAIRQDVILIAEIVEASGTRFAAPTQLTYLSSDTGIDAEKSNDIVRRVSELRAGDTFRFPGEARAGTKWLPFSATGYGADALTTSLPLEPDDGRAKSSERKHKLPIRNPKFETNPNGHPDGFDKGVWQTLEQEILLEWSD